VSAAPARKSLALRVRQGVRVDLSRCRRVGGPHALLILFSAALLWRPLFGGEALFWGTPLLQFVPWQRLAADMWRGGYLPLWNPLVGCGAPLAANYQTAAFYPLNGLHLLLPAEAALSWTVALHIALAGWGAYHLGRAVGLDRFPALVGALALEGSGFLVARATLFPSIALTFPWIAIWLWRAEIVVQAQARTNGSRRAGLRAALLMGLAVGLGLLAGHAQTAFYGGVLTAAYAGFRTLQRIRHRGQRRHQKSGDETRVSDQGCWLPGVLRAGGLFALSLALGVGLAAIQLLPTAELLLNSQRSGGVSTDTAMTYSFWPWRLITALAPGFFGTPGQGSYWGYGAHWEDALYVGMLPLLLAGAAAVLALRRGARSAPPTGGDPHQRDPGAAGRASTWAAEHRALTRFWLVSALVGLVLALGKNTPIFPFLFRRIPGFDLFQAPTRWLAVTTVALALLSGIGLQRRLRGGSRRETALLTTTVGGGLLVAGLAARRLVDGTPTTFGPATARLGAALGITGALALVRRRLRRGEEWALVWWRLAALIFVALDLLTVGWPMVPSVARSLYRGETRTAEILRDASAHPRVYWPADPSHSDRQYDALHRVKFDYLSFDDFGPSDLKTWWGMREDQIPNAGMLDQVASVNNFDPLLVRWYADLMDAAVEEPGVLSVMGVTHVATDQAWSAGEHVHSGASADFYRVPGAPGRAWIAYEARRVAPSGALAAVSSPSFDPAEVVLIDTAPLEQARSDQSRPSLTEPVLRDGPNRVTIRAILDAPGYLVLADTWYPGWRARVDDEAVPVLRANHAFRTVQLTAGEHVVEMVYRPRSVLVGGATSAAALGLFLSGMLIWRRDRGKA